MCTIHTYSAKFYRKNMREINGQILQDSVINDDGISVIFLDGHNAKKNTVLRTMSPEHAIGTIQALMDDATKHARVFVHLRAATTTHVGVGFTHAFDDMQGVFYMHNGVITNTSSLAVDSFNMVNWADTRGSGLLVNLLGRKENFANVFRIDTVGYKWSMTRMSSGSLHTDGHGNYSSRAFGPLISPVEHQSTQSYTLQFIPKPIYGNYYRGSTGGTGGTGAATGSGAAFGYGSGYSPGGQRVDGYYGPGYRGDWNEGKRWDWEVKGYVSEAEWERNRKARSDKWTAMYEEDEVAGDGSYGVGDGKTIPAFTSRSSRQEERDENAAVDSVMRTLGRNKGGLETARQLLDDGDIVDPLDTEVNLDGTPMDGGEQEESVILTANDLADLEYMEQMEELERVYGYRSYGEDGYSLSDEGILTPNTPGVVPVVLGPPASLAPQGTTSVAPVLPVPSLELPERSSNILEPRFDAVKYQIWLRKKQQKGA